MKIRMMLTMLTVLFTAQASGQDLSVKTNLLHWSTTSPNLAFELKTGKKSSFEVAGAYNDWSLGSNKRFAHWIVQPEYRRWFCETFAGSFLGFHAHGGEFNVSRIGPFTTLKNNRTEGWFVGAGVSYGHQWILSNRWSFEAEIGLGYTYFDYEKYECGNCGPMLDKGKYHYFGPTRAALSFVYYIR